MAFLVKDLVDRQIFGGVRLVAGVLNVSNPILWVNVMEILDTPRSLNEGELVVSTGYGLEDQSLHKDLIHQLKKRGVSGLAIQPGYYIDQIPEYIIEDANKEGLPVLELPERLSFSEILHVLMDQITENNLISRKLVQGLDTLRIALGKKLNISEKKLFEKEQQAVFSQKSSRTNICISANTKRRWFGARPPRKCSYKLGPWSTAKGSLGYGAYTNSKVF